MNIRLLKSAIAAAAMGAAAFAPIAASAQSRHHHGGGHYHHGSHYPGSWHGGGHYWNGGRYYGGRYYYGPRYGYYDNDDSGAWVAGTIFGLAAGAMAAGAASHNAVGYCERRFRSYDPASGTYLGYDGYRHPCP